MQPLEHPWQPGSFQQSPTEKDWKHAPHLWRSSTRKQGQILLKQNTAFQNKRHNHNSLVCTFFDHDQAMSQFSNVL